jgi:hypothetical protein
MLPDGHVCYMYKQDFHSNSAGLLYALSKLYGKLLFTLLGFLKNASILAETKS